MVGEVNRLKGLIQRDNSSLEEKFDEGAIQANFVEFNNIMEDLIKLKAQIQIATAPISDKLIRMAELKGLLGWYSVLTVKEGTIEVDNYRTEKTKTEKWSCFLTQTIIDDTLANIQREIESLQDEVDEYNASTDI